MKIKNLVLSGGGVKGICYLGIIKYLEEKNIIKDIKNIVTSSVGAIFGLFIALGYTYLEQKTLLDEIKITKLFNLYNININHFTNKFGLDNGKKIDKFINLLISKKFGKSDITFLDLYKKSSINLIITGSCLNKQELVYFNYKDTPNMPLQIALRITYSLPFVFDKVTYEENIYVDGGLLNNFPIDYFKKNIKETIGITLTGKKILNDLHNLDNYIMALIYAPSYSFHNKLLSKYKENICIIDSDIDILDINLNKEEISILINKGYNCIDKFLSHIIL
uniref:PNPLA domain-containing protein n=1 Tax=viral metagenome TaxID=1070528 RepID=A0A6C0IWJ6_9ZZZZ